MIESHANRLEIKSETCHSTKQSNSTKKKSDFKSRVVAKNIPFSNYIPFGGCLNFWFSDYRENVTTLDLKKISNKTAVVTLSSYHVAVIMGGFKEEPRNSNISQEQSNRNIMNWGLAGDVKEQPSGLFEIIKNPLYKGKIAYLAFMFNYLAILYCREYADPSFYCDVISASLSPVICFALHRLRMLSVINDFVATFDNLGSNHSISSGRFVSIPVNGLDVQNMREQSDKIKREARFNFLDNNCSIAVIDCLKSGLTKEQVKALPKQGLIPTPTDVGEMIDFMIYHQYVKLIDQQYNDDDEWFDAQEHLN